MSRQLSGALSILALLCACTLLGLAQEKPAPKNPEPAPAGPPAVLELILPTGATATADGKELAHQRTVTIDGIKPTETRRVKLAVKFRDGTTEERLVDVLAGQRVPVPVAQPGPEKPTTVATQQLVPVTSAAISRDGRHIAVGLEDHAVVLWDTTIGRPVRTFIGHQKAVLSVAFSTDGNHLLTGSSDATAALWETHTGRRIQTFKGHTRSVLGAALSPDGARVLTGSSDATAILWSVQTGKPIHTLKGHRNDVTAVAYHPNGTTLATASADLTAALWDAESGKQTVVLKGHKEGLSCIAFTPDGHQVGTGSWENLSIVWETATGKRIASTTKHNNDVISIGFTSDGRRIISGDREEVVIMWDAATGEKVRTFFGHNADVISIATSSDGRMLLTGSRDGTAKLWDLATGRELLTLVSDAARKSWAVVAPDGLFDASEQGRRGMGFRFAKLPGIELDQIFTECYRPGLLAEVGRGERPLASKPLGRSRPPLLKIASPKSRVSTTQETMIAVDVADQGGGVSGLVVEINGVRVAAPARTQPGRDKRSTQTTFNVFLAPGVNKVRVKAASRDGSWESIPAEVELTFPRAPEQRSRMYVVAVGVGRSAATDARALADLFLRHSGKLYDRVDIIRVFDRDATRATIEDTVKDVAELTRPQDTLAVLLCGQGAQLGERFFFAPHDFGIGADRPEDALSKRGVALDDLAASIGTAPALKRLLIVDAASSGGMFGEPVKGRSEFALRGMVTRIARSQGVFTLAAVTAASKALDPTPLTRGIIASTLLATADEAEHDSARETLLEPTARSIDVTDWFQFAADRAAPLMQKLTGNSQDVQASTQFRGFPILVFDK